jgi:hypothetical protein
MCYAFVYDEDQYGHMVKNQDLDSDDFFFCGEVLAKVTPTTAMKLSRLEEVPSGYVGEDLVSCSTQKVDVFIIGDSTISLGRTSKRAKRGITALEATRVICTKHKIYDVLSRHGATMTELVNGVEEYKQYVRQLQPAGMLPDMLIVYWCGNEFCNNKVIKPWTDEIERSMKKMAGLLSDMYNVCTCGPGTATLWKVGQEFDECVKKAVAIVNDSGIPMVPIEALVNGASMSGNSHLASTPQNTTRLARHHTTIIEMIVSTNALRCMLNPK